MKCINSLLREVSTNVDIYHPFQNPNSKKDEVIYTWPQKISFAPPVCSHLGQNSTPIPHLQIPHFLFINLNQQLFFSSFSVHKLPFPQNEPKFKTKYWIHNSLKNREWKVQNLFDYQVIFPCLCFFRRVTCRLMAYVR